MEAFIHHLQDFFTNKFDIGQFSIIALIILAVTVILGLLGRFVFGKRGTLSISVMSAVTILGVYILTIILASTSTKLSFLAAPLPFITIRGDALIFFNLYNAGFAAICSEFLSLMLLAFMVNLLERWMPKGKKLLSWYFFRFLSVALAVCVNYVLVIVLGKLLPFNFAQISSTVVVIIILASLLLGALKVVVGGALAFINPLFALLYAFFFSNFIGKMLTRAILTSAIITAGVWALTHFGVASICIAPAALIAYIPFLLVMLVMWFIIGKLL